jgi:hypothetical protein
MFDDAIWADRFILACELRSGSEMPSCSFGDGSLNNRRTFAEQRANVSGARAQRLFTLRVSVAVRVDASQSVTDDASARLSAMHESSE